MKKIIVIILAFIFVATLPVLFSSCSSNYEKDVQDDFQNWMQDQADGKDHDYDDGGSYYCMGKNDTCNNKTKNAYDLYCSSCDPDGDNMEGSNYKDEVNDWMQDQAVGKDYDYDDGGSYYCMGKNDTCNNKTKNAYDLYCSSCDPDGDNSQG